MAQIRGSGPCATCKINPRETGCYCRSCSNKKRNTSVRPKIPCSVCGINPKILGRGKKHCGVCIDLTREYEADNPDVRRQYQRTSKYKLNKELMISLLIFQDSKCAICPNPITLETLQVDHDHRCCPSSKTCGECVRGFLCVTCNSALGKFNDSIDRLFEAIEYLRNPITKEWRKNV